MKKINIDDVRDEFNRCGFILLSEYISSKKKIKYKCPNGHIHSMKLNDWRNCSIKCPVCSNNKRPTINYIGNVFKLEGYLLLSTLYKNNNTKLEFICPNNHRHNISWKKWSLGQRCGKCSISNKLTDNHIRKEVESFGLRFLKTYFTKDEKRNRRRIIYICAKGHIVDQMWDGFKNGRRCIVCLEESRAFEGNPNWRGGISFEQYCPVWKDKNFKESIKQRDGYKCLNPHCNSKKSEDLTVHHIDYNKKNCHPKNLITLCRSCNSKANFDRKNHEAYYKNVVR